MAHQSPITWRPTSCLYRAKPPSSLHAAAWNQTFDALLKRSTNDIEWFWDAVVRDLDMRWLKPYDKVLDLSEGVEWPHWFVGGKYNYVYNAVDKWANADNPNNNLSPEHSALIWEGEERRETCSLTYNELRRDVAGRPMR